MRVEEAEMELEAFAKTWDSQYPSISQSWRNDWPNLIAFIYYPNEIRKIIYTTNAIESVNSVIRKTTSARKIFPNDQSAMKVVYLAIENAAKKWSMASTRRKMMAWFNRCLIAEKESTAFLKPVTVIYSVNMAASKNTNK